MNFCYSSLAGFPDVVAGKTREEGQREAQDKAGFCEPVRLGGSLASPYIFNLINLSPFLVGSPAFLVCLGLRGFLEEGAFSAKTEVFLDKPGRLVILPLDTLSVAAFFFFFSCSCNIVFFFLLRMLIIDF